MKFKECWCSILFLLALFACSAPHEPNLEKNKNHVAAVEESTAIKWQEINPMDDSTVYLVNLGYLKVKTDALADERVAKFFPAIIEQLKKSPGAIRFAPFRRNREFWNLTVWTDAKSMQRFVASKAHQDAINYGDGANSFVEDFKFTDYHLRKAEMPKDWQELIDKSRQ